MPLRNNLALAQLRRLPRPMPKFWSGEPPSEALLNISESDGAIYKMNWTTEVFEETDPTHAVDSLE